MNNSRFQQISHEGTALLAESPFYFKPANYTGVIPLLAIQAIVPATREKDHVLQPLIPGKSFPVVEVRLEGNCYALTLDDATKFIEKLRRLHQAFPAS